MFKPSKEHIRHALIYEFHKKTPVEDAFSYINIAYGKDSIALNTCQKWYTKFHGGDFDIADKPKTGRKVQFDVEKLIDTLRRDSSLSLSELQKLLGASSETIRRHLKLKGWMHKHGRWVEKSTKANREAREKARKQYERLDQTRALDQVQSEDLRQTPLSIPFTSSSMLSTNNPPMSPVTSTQAFIQSPRSPPEPPKASPSPVCNTQAFVESISLPLESSQPSTCPILNLQKIPESPHGLQMQIESGLVLPSEARLLSESSPRSISQPSEAIE